MIAGSKLIHISGLGERWLFNVIIGPAIVKLLGYIIDSAAKSDKSDFSSRIHFHSFFVSTTCGYAQSVSFDVLTECSTVSSVFWYCVERHLQDADRGLM